MKYMIRFPMIFNLESRTRMWNMISSPTTPTVSWAEIWEFSKSRRDIIDAVTISKIIVPEIICHDAYQCREFSKSRRDIIDAVTISKIIVPEIICHDAYQCQGHPVRLWCWPLTCNIDKCYSLRSFLGMYNIERQVWYWHLLTRHCPCNLLPEPISPKHEHREKLWGQPVMSSMTSSPLKTFWT